MFPAVNLSLISSSTVLFWLTTDPRYLKDWTDSKLVVSISNLFPVSCFLVHFIYFVLFSFINRPNFDASFFILVNISIIACLVIPVITIPSPYTEICVSLVDILHLASSFRIITFIAMLNSSAKSGSPCFTPDVISNFSVISRHYLHADGTRYMV